MKLVDRGVMNTVRTTECEVSTDPTTVSDFFTRTEGRKNIEKLTAGQGFMQESSIRERLLLSADEDLCGRYKSLDIVKDFLN